MIPQLIEKRVIDAIRNALSGVAIDISPSPVPPPVSGAASPSNPAPVPQCVSPAASPSNPAPVPQCVSPAASPSSPAALLPIQIFGTWQPATVGFIKNQEEASSIATVAVAVGTQSRSTFSTCAVAFQGSVVLRIRAERDVTGTALLALSEPLENLFRTWQGETYQKAFTDLDVEGFQCGDIAVSGSVPSIDFGAKLITISWTFTLNGVDS